MFRRVESRPIRVLYFAGTHGNWGGASRVLFTTLSLLDRARVEPVVALPMEGPALALLADMQIESVVWGPMAEYRSPWQYARAVARTVLWLRRHAIDIVHMNRANDWRPAEHVGARLARVSIVTHFHTVNLDRAPATRMSTAIAAVSEFVATHSDCQGVPVQVIHNSVNPDTYGQGRNIRREFGLEDDDVLVTFAGQIRKIKGVDLFIAAARKVGGSCIKFLVVGECRKTKGIDDAYTADELNDLATMDGRISYAGYRTDMPDIYSSSDIVVAPSRWDEPFGLILIEAGAAARPVVATRVGGIPEVVIDGQTGLLVERDDVVGLAGAIERLAKDKDLRCRMGIAAREHVSSEFIRKPVAALEGLYEKLVWPKLARQARPVRNHQREGGLK